MSKTLISSLVVVLLVVVEISGKQAPKVDKVNHPVMKTMLFRLEHPDGPKRIRTYPEAVKLCQKYKANVADNWRLRDAVHKQNFDPCQGCGWLKKNQKWYKNYRPECGEKEEKLNKYFYPCADDPKDQKDMFGLQLEGYDVYCWGKIYPQLPNGAVPMNPPKGQRGYVYLLKDREEGFIPTRSLGITNCRKRGAEIATAAQVIQAWYNGLDRCECGWMLNYQGQATHQKLPSCGGRIGFDGCPYGTISHSFCFVDQLDRPMGLNVVDFDKLSPGAFPSGIETGAIQISGGYVYPTPSFRGRGNTESVFTAYQTCSDQGGMVATRTQITQAMKKGMTWCKCGYIWEKQNEVAYGMLVQGPQKAVRLASSKNEAKSCDGKTGVIDCTNEKGNKDLFCYKKCPGACPPDTAWNTPAGSTRIASGIVFHMEHPSGSYKINSKSAAEKLCKLNRGSILATGEQLLHAMENGMTRCSCGYVSDGVQFPMAHSIKGCGDEVGVFSCDNGQKYSSIKGKSPNWDVYCFLENKKLNVKRWIRHIGDGIKI